MEMGTNRRRLVLKERVVTWMVGALLGMALLLPARSGWAQCYECFCLDTSDELVSCTSDINLATTFCTTANTGCDGFGQISTTACTSLPFSNCDTILTPPPPSPPTVAKSFGAPTIPGGGTTTLVLVITNPNAGSSLSSISVTDNLPAGLTVASTPNVTSDCTGTLTADPGATLVSLSGGALAAAGSCTIAVDVVGIAPGVQDNTTGIITAAESGDAGATSNTASVTVVAPPSIAKSFTAASVLLGNVVRLELVITNSNATVALTGVAVTDNLPPGLQVAADPESSNSCGGTLAAGGTTINLSGVTIPASGSCLVAINVVGTSTGLKTNITGPVASNEGGTGAPAGAQVTVLALPAPALSSTGLVMLIVLLALIGGLGLPARLRSRSLR